MQILFLPATLADLDVVLSMQAELYRQDGTPHDPEKARASFSGLLADSRHGGCWLIRSDDEIAGYVILTLGYSIEFGGVDGFVDEVFVRESLRGRGLGTAALAHVENEARARGVIALHLEVARANVRAQELYRRWGFVDHDRYLMTKWMEQKT